MKLLIFDFPYHWRSWRTVLKNLRCIPYDLRTGLRNLKRWFPIIWFDEDFDWAYLARIMEFKLRNMEKYIREYGCHVHAQKDARRMLVCALLLKRLREDEYDEGEYLDKSWKIRRSEKRAKYDQEYLGKLLGKHLRSWWD